eukprot:415377_1
MGNNESVELDEANGNGSDVCDKTMLNLQISTSIGSNDVLYCPYDLTTTEQKCNDKIDNVVFFGGDVQDFHKNMVIGESFDEYGDYCLEKVSEILKDKFPVSNVLLIRPCQRNGYISIFSNFIADIDIYGQAVPSHKNGNGCKHLFEILCSKEMNISNNKLHLIGFSRGVNVLNQLIYETCEKNENKNEVNELFKRVKSMYFLDGGNGSLGATLPNDYGIIDNFIGNVINDGFTFYIYGTSYQWKDKNRLWIGTEQKYFVDTIKLLQTSGKYKKKYFVHHNFYADQLLNESWLRNNVKSAKVLKNKAIYRHFELLRLF